MRALLAKLKGPGLFVRYMEEFGKNHVRKNEGQLYFQDKHKTSLFCIAILSKLTIRERFIKWCSWVRFGVAKCSVFWNYISDLNQPKIISSLKIRFSIFPFLIEPF